MASSSIKMICPKCFQTARVTSSYTYLMCGHCHMDMVKAPVFPRSGKDGRSGRLGDSDLSASGC